MHVYFNKLVYANTRSGCHTDNQNLISRYTVTLVITLRNATAMAYKQKQGMMKYTVQAK